MTQEAGGHSIEKLLDPENNHMEKGRDQENNNVGTECVKPQPQPQPQQDEEYWDLSTDFELFAKYQVRTICFPASARSNGRDPSSPYSNEDNNGNMNPEKKKSLDIEFMEPDSPLDILNNETSSSQYDATGHCVWAGAFLLIECLVKHDMSEYSLGDGKRIIEFGCGTGIGGLALALLNDSMQLNHNNAKMSRTKTSYVCFTDADPAVLEVCQRNCTRNKLQSDTYSIKTLTWGEDIAGREDFGSLSFDVGLATDVLYDVDLIDPLFATVSSLVVPEGIFILSHIPRACYNEDNPPEARKDLEKYITDKAATHGLILEKVIRPPCPEELSLEILTWCSPTAFCGAGLFVFRHEG